MAISTLLITLQLCSKIWPITYYVITGTGSYLNMAHALFWSWAKYNTFFDIRTKQKTCKLRSVPVRLYHDFRALSVTKWSLWKGDQALRKVPTKILSHEEWFNTLQYHLTCLRKNDPNFSHSIQGLTCHFLEILFLDSFS